MISENCYIDVFDCTGQVTSKLETFYMLNNRKSLEFRCDLTSRCNYPKMQLSEDDNSQKF